MHFANISCKLETCDYPVVALAADDMRVELTLLKESYTASHEPKQFGLFFNIQFNPVQIFH
jgi:hypothetical protein